MENRMAQFKLSIYLVVHHPSVIIILGLVYFTRHLSHCCAPN